jgi:hypothetical protein
MRLFTLIDFHHFLLALFLGGAAAIVVYLAFRYGGGSNGKEADAGEGEGGENIDGEAYHRYPDGIGIGDNPMPPVLMFVLIGFIVWLICYAVFFGIFGGPV